MDRLGREPALSQNGHLVLDQRDQRADDKGCSTPRQPGQLIANRLPRACWHDEQNVASVCNRLTNLLLVGPKGRERECLLQKPKQVRPPLAFDSKRCGTSTHFVF